jgi:tRNA A-37 threonylcarbamoyl transferase component Bud32
MVPHHLNTAPPVPLSRGLLERLPRTSLHAGRNVSKASIDVVEHEGRTLVVKDVAHRPFWVRTILGPFQLRREARAYRRLAGLEGIPALVQVIDRRALAMERIPGRAIREVPRGAIPPVFFDRLLVLIQAIHARGVAHGDLHHGDVLVAPGDRPYVIDFSTASFTGRRRGRARKFFFDQARLADLRNVAKLRRRWLGESAAPVPDRPLLYQVGTTLRRILGL